MNALQQRAQPGNGEVAPLGQDRYGSHREVSVLIACYNQARFLGEAIESVLTQTVTPSEIIVVDDGSTDDPSSVVARYAEVQYIRQSNQGLAAARNAGLRASSGANVIFLDADDHLLPTAVEAGLICLAECPGCAFAYGQFRFVDEYGQVLFQPPRVVVDDDLYRMLLRRNHIAMHATVMYRRSALTDIGGFDVSLRACEDYDMYLKLTRRFPAASHSTLTAEYRIHGGTTTGNTALMLRHSLAVLRKQRRSIAGSPADTAAFRQGIVFWQHYYGDRLISQLVQDVRQRTNWKAVAGASACLLRHNRPGLFRLARRTLRRGGRNVLARFGHV